MSSYLSREQLAEARNCAPTSYRTMERRLRAMGWPHQPRPGACPLVLRSVHDAIMAGQKPTAAAARARPNFDALGGGPVTDDDSARIAAMIPPDDPDPWLLDRLESFVRTREQIIDGARPDVDSQWQGGVYVMVNDGRIDYVGLTSQWGIRAQQHQQAGKSWQRLYTIDVPHANVMPLVEWPYIDVIAPPWNRKFKRPLCSPATGALRDRLLELWK